MQSLEVQLSRSGDDIGDGKNNGADDAACKLYYPYSPRDPPSRAAIFSVGEHLSPWVPMLLLLGGDIETNPGPPTYICRLCKQIINKRQTSIQCNSKSKHWIHLKCSGTRLKDYNSSFLCNLHSNQDSTTDTDQSSDNDHSTTSTSTSPASSSSHSRTQSSNFDSLPLTDSHNQSATDSSLSSSPISPLSSTPKSSHSSSPDSSHSSSPKSSSDNDSTSRLTPPRPKNLKILQININGLRNKTTELNLLVKSTKPEIITVQETKLNSKLKTPDIPNYSSIRKDRTTDGGGGLMTYIHHSITFTEITTPNNNNQIETIVTKLDTTPPLHITNCYIPPRTDTTIIDDQNNTSLFNQLFNFTNNIITGDFNAHHHSWHSPTNDHRGITINNIINNSTHTIINDNKPTRLPPQTHLQRQQPTSPDLTILPTHLTQNSTWTTLQQLPSDHLPIITTAFITTKQNRSHKRKTFTNYNKALWKDFTTWIDNTLRAHTPSDNIHHETKFITDTIIQADKQFIPRGNIRNRNKPIPPQILSKINNRNHLRSTNPNHPQIAILNREINKDIADHKQQIWKQHVNTQWDQKHNQKTYWNTIKSLNNKQPTSTDPNRSIKFNNNTLTSNKAIANAFNKYYTNPTNFNSDRNKRQTIRQLHNLETTPITLTTNQVLSAIKNAKSSKATGPDNIAPIHMKHLSYHSISIITQLYNKIINTNIIPTTWKIAKIIPILKPNKDPNVHTSYRPIALLSPLAKILESTIHTIIRPHLPACSHQHGFKQKHSITTALHSIIDPIITGFNQRRPPGRTALIAIDFSQAFDTVNIITLINKIINNTTIPNLLKKFIGNYIHGRQGYTTYNNQTSKIHIFKTGVPQGGVLSPSLFNLYLSDIPTPANPLINLTGYADDITITATHTNYRTAETILQPYLDSITNWAEQNNLILNTSKTQTTLFTPDPAEYSKSLNLHF